MTYNSKIKEELLINNSKNSYSYNINNHIKVSTDNNINYFTGEGYKNLNMKVLLSDKEGYRLYCKVKKGNIELPHYHKGRYELFMIKGKMLYKNEKTNEELILKKGDYYYNPPYLLHSSICLEDSEFLWLYNKIPDCNL